MQNRIEEFQREQIVAQSCARATDALIGVARRPSTTTGRCPRRRERAEAGRSGAGGTKTAGLLSLFASNVALTYRKTSSSAPTPEPESASAPTPLPAPVGPRPRSCPAMNECCSLPVSLHRQSLSGRNSERAPETNHDRKEEPKNPAAVAAGVSQCGGRQALSAF